MATKYTVINDRFSSVEYETTFDEILETKKEAFPEWEGDLEVCGEAIVTESGEIIAVETNHEFRPRKSLPSVCDLCGGKHGDE